MHGFGFLEHYVKDSQGRTELGRHTLRKDQECCNYSYRLRKTEQHCSVAVLLGSHGGVLKLRSASGFSSVIEGLNPTRFIFMARPQRETSSSESVLVNLGWTTPTGWTLVSGGGTHGGTQGGFGNAMPRGMGAPPQQMMPQQQVQGDGHIGHLLSTEECARLVRYVISINQFPAHEML